eukprot:PhF_6_TR26349/c0_g1_i2/m.37938
MFQTVFALSCIFALVNADKPIDIPCVTWIPWNESTPTDPTNLFRAAHTWVVTVQGDPSSCVGEGDIFPCFSADAGTNTWGHHDYVSGEYETDPCRSYVNNQVKYSKTFYLPQKGPQWQTWTWQQAQTGGQVPDNAIRFNDKVMARSTQNPPGYCVGQGFTGWAVGLPNGTFGDVHFSIAKDAVTWNNFEVAVCTAYHPTPTPAPPGPTPPPPSPTPAPTLPPNNKPYIRFANTIPATNLVDAVITQGTISYTWTAYAFAQFSQWVEIFQEGTGTISIYENVNGQRGPLLVSAKIPLTPGPLVVVTKDFWPPKFPYNVETIAASYVPNPLSSGVRLFNLSPDTKAAGMSENGKTLVDNVPYTLGSDWVTVPQTSGTFTVYDETSKSTLATMTTSPPQPPFVFTAFLLGLQNATSGSTYATKVIPLIDAPES